MVFAPAVHGVASAYPTVTDPDANLWIRAVYNAGGVVSQSRANVVQTLISSLKSNTIWNTKLDRMWILGFADQHPIQAQIDLVNRQSWTQIGTGTLGAGGWTGNGTTGILNSNFNPGDGGSYNFTQNSMHTGLYDRSSSTTAQTAAGNYDSVTTHQTGCFMNLAAVGTAPNLVHNFYLSMDNDLGATLSSTVQATNNGRYIGTRTGAGSSAPAIYKNGSDISNILGTESVSAASPNLSIYLGGANQDGSASNFSTDQYAYFHFGAGLDATQASNMDTALSACMTSLGI